MRYRFCPGTAYALYDEEAENYGCAIRSDRDQLGEYVGLTAEASGPVGDVGRGWPL